MSSTSPVPSEASSVMAGAFETWVRSVEREAASSHVTHLEANLLEALREKNIPSALMLASVIAYMDEDHDVARRIKRHCARAMRSLVMRTLPPPDAIPRVSVDWEDLFGQELPREAAFLLACIDGTSTLQELIDVTAMTPLSAYEALDTLLAEGVVAVR